MLNGLISSISAAATGKTPIFKIALVILLSRFCVELIDRRNNYIVSLMLVIDTLSLNYYSIFTTSIHKIYTFSILICCISYLDDEDQLLDELALRWRSLGGTNNSSSGVNLVGMNHSEHCSEFQMNLVQKPRPTSTKSSMKSRKDYYSVKNVKSNIRSFLYQVYLNMKRALIIRLRKRSSLVIYSVIHIIMAAALSIGFSIFIQSSYLDVFDPPLPLELQSYFPSVLSNYREQNVLDLGFTQLLFFMSTALGTASALAVVPLLAGQVLMIATTLYKIHVIYL